MKSRSSTPYSKHVPGDSFKKGAGFEERSYNEKCREWDEKEISKDPESIDLCEGNVDHEEIGDSVINCDEEVAQEDEAEKGLSSCI